MCIDGKVVPANLVTAADIVAAVVDKVLGISETYNNDEKSSIST